jgi:hypothetical protein
MQAFLYEKMYIFEENVRDYFRNKFNKNIQDALEPSISDVKDYNNTNNLENV